MLSENARTLMQGPQVLNGLRHTFLVATGALNGTAFDHAVIYMVSHTPEGAMGLVVNKPNPNIQFRQITAGMGIEDILSEGRQSPTGTYSPPIIYKGGPVENNRGFVLHTGDYALPGSLSTGVDVALTATVDIVNDIAHGRGPRKMNFCLGYAGWGPGQLEDELHTNGWLVVPANTQILFELDPPKRYDAATRALGLDALNFIDTTGQA